jgi:VWFA-related protein
MQFSSSTERVLSGIFWSLSLVLAATNVVAQSVPGVILRSETNLVQVRVAALDSKGRPVTDLKRQDFQILDNRKTQAITLFVADRGSRAATDPSATEPTTSTDVAKSSGYALILLDWINTPMEEQVRARDAAVKALDTFTPGQKIAVYLLGEHSGLLQNFTTDRDELKYAIDRAGFEMGKQEASTPGRFDARYAGKTPVKLTAEEELFFANRRVDASLLGLNYVADHMSHLPGMKTLIWISTAFPVIVNGAKPAELVFVKQVNGLIAKLNRADISVCAVDPRGLQAGSGGTRGYVDTMIELAERTGGTVFTARNDIDTGIRLALEDGLVGYTLGFHIAEGAAMGLHQLKVIVKRPGVYLRYRESFYVGNDRQ